MGFELTVSWKEFTSEKLVRSATWYSKDWGLFAYAFKQSADLVFSQYKKTRRDAFWFPSVFLYRQWIELSLKSLWIEINKIDGSLGEFPRTHNFQKLWPDLRAWLVARSFFVDGDQFVVSAERIFSELDKIDPGGTAFKYPPDKLPHSDIINFSVKDFEVALDEIETVFVGLFVRIDEYSEFLFATQPDGA